ncbi:MAG: transposase [candidate division Zixibacteria bacterium]|nr:transposase [candidate division Zixibacteria bacterium]
MHNVKRYFKHGQIYFMTHVAYERRPILAENADILHRAFEHHNDRQPFILHAWAILPDHLHFIIDPLENDPANLIKRIKLSFASNYRKRMGLHDGRVWQNRFWDHIIRNQQDYNRHFDYIHYNAVKHGIVTKPIDYPYSSFIDYYHKGYYDDDWSMVYWQDMETVFGE